VAIIEITSRLERRTSVLPVRQSMCFQLMPWSSSCMQIAFLISCG
jgi:hypothetical protein